MATVHISKTEAERDLAGLLARINADTSFLIEENAEPVAILQAVPPRKRTLHEVMAALPASANIRMDAGFAEDVEAGIALHREPLDSSIWD
jgi:antitoxin (DNA-binding transcriptional repressor) of toxin-antitoxin stability system